MTAIDWTKPVQTKDGRKVRVLCTDARGRNPVIGLVLNEDEETDEMMSWPISGDAWGPDHDYSLDLINVPEKHTLWVNVWRDKADNLFTVVDFDQDGSDRDASGAGMYKLAARFTREFHEGEGVS